MIFGLSWKLEANLSKSLTEIYGINKSTSLILVHKLGLTQYSKVKHVKYKHERLLLVLLRTTYTVDVVLKRQYKAVIMDMPNQLVKTIKFRRGLPVHNQRTKTNNKTARYLNPLIISLKA